MLPLDKRRALEEVIAMSERGWCPFARQHRGYRREGPFGYPAGARGQNRPVLFVDHRMGGWKRTLDDDGWRHDNWVGVHFGIGRDGSIDQYTNIFDASWGNGVSGSIAKYDRSNPRLALLETLGRWVTVPYAGTVAYALVADGVNIPNTHTISIEHEDEGRDQPWPEAMVEATIRVKRWCLAELDKYGLPMAVDHHMLIGHHQIDGVHRTGCPGSHWPRQRILDAITQQEEDEMKSFLAWCPDYAGGSVWFVGPNGARWITDARIVAELEAQFGKVGVALSAKALNAIGIAR